MEVQMGFCETRSSLERRCFKLVNKLSVLTTALTQLIETNHATFLAAKADCDEARRELADVRRQIQGHQVDHKCSPYPL